MLPWQGGVNSTQDPAVIPQNQLTVASNLVFGVRGSRKKRDGINFNWDNVAAGSVSIIGQHDFWFGNNPKTQLRIGVGDNKATYSYNSSGVRSSAITDSGTAWGTAITLVSMETMNNLLLIAVDGANNVVKKWSGTGNLQDLGTNSFTADGTNGNPTLANVSSFLGAVIGGNVSGTGIAANTFISSMTATSITLTNNFTGVTGAGLSFKYVNPPPVASILREHIGRMWANDKTNSDRVHFTTTGNPDEWLGLGDSGAMDIGVGDGDPMGVTAIFPTFQGVLFIAKLTKLYRIDGDSPDNFRVTLVSDGIGCVSHNAIANEDQDDIFFVSQRGIHSINTTANYGDFENTFVSFDIQKTFLEKWTFSRLKYMWAAYLSNLNSIAFAVTDESYGTGSNNAVWLYNIPLKSWYVWPAISCASMITVLDADKRRLYFGGNNSRIAKSLVGTNYDTSSSNAHVAISMQIRTGITYPGNQPYYVNGYKKFALIYGPKGTHTITVNFTIDNYAPTSLSYSLQGSSALLGSTFVLGSSVLGYTAVTAPYIQPVEGFGRGFQVEMLQSGIDEEAEIQGFAVEYEAGGPGQETVAGSTD